MSIPQEARAAALEAIGKSGVTLEEVRMGIRERFIVTGMSWAESDALIFMHEALIEEALVSRIRSRIEGASRPVESGRYAEAGYNDHFNDGLSAAEDLLEDPDA